MDVKDSQQEVGVVTKSKFKLKKVTSATELLNNPGTEMPESDLLLSKGDNFFQFDYVSDEVVKKAEVGPGIFTFGKGLAGLYLIPTEITLPPMLESIDNTAVIKNELKAFRSKYSVYEDLNLQKKRSILYYSAPGYGKTAAIQRTCLDTVKEDPNTLVLIWPTGQIDASAISSFLCFGVEYKNVSNLILIIEDIGGQAHSHEGHGGPRHVDPDLLNLLEGIGNPFKIPTFIMATTNYPQNLLSALANRPGRFDQLIELSPPSNEERIALMEFIAKHPLNEEQRKALTQRGVERFSIAHLKEIVIRSRLHDKSYAEVVAEMIAHEEKFNNGFDKRGKVGLL